MHSGVSGVLVALLCSKISVRCCGHLVAGLDCLVVARVVLHAPGEFVLACLGFDVQVIVREDRLPAGVEFRFRGVDALRPYQCIEETSLLDAQLVAKLFHHSFKLNDLLHCALCFNMLRRFFGFAGLASLSLRALGLFRLRWR